MARFKEITVRLKNDEQTFTQKFACYAEGVTLSDTDPILMSYIEQAKEGFKAQVEDCIIKINMVI